MGCLSCFGYPVNRSRLGAFIVTARLVQLQVIDHQRYAAEARVTHVSEETISDRRGALLDRHATAVPHDAPAGSGPRRVDW